jgi:signal transduction histidine kinase
MKTFFIILGIICLSFQMLVWTCCFIVNVFSSKETKKELKEISDKAMKDIYPDWPNVNRTIDDLNGNIHGGTAWFPGMF